MKYSKNVKIVLETLQNEVDGDIKSALEKMTDDYSMTWMYKKGREVFPSTSNQIENELKDVYPIRERKYEIKNITENKDVVMIELIESYPNPKTKKVYRTPQVIVLEMKKGKIKRGRHYCDPNISYLHLTKEQIEKGLKRTKSKVIIE